MDTKGEISLLALPRLAPMRQPLPNIGAESVRAACIFWRDHNFAQDMPGCLRERLEQTLQLIGSIASRIGNPTIDRGLAPARAVDAARRLARECGFGDHAIEGRTGQSCAGKHSLYSDDPFTLSHGTLFHSMMCHARHGNRIGGPQFIRKTYLASVGQQ